MRSIIRIRTRTANPSGLKAMPANLQHSPPDMIVSIGGDHAAIERKLLNHVAVRQEGEFQATFRRLALLPRADQRDLCLRRGRLCEDKHEDGCEAGIYGADHSILQ